MNTRTQRNHLRWIGLACLIAVLISLYQPAYALTTVTNHITAAASSTYGVPTTFTSTITDGTNGGSTPTGSVTFYDGGTFIGTQDLIEDIPVVVNKPAGTAPIPANLKLTCTTSCPVIEWGDLSYWAYSDMDNLTKLYLVGYDANNTVVKSWIIDGDRYFTAISVNTTERTFTFTGQAGSVISRTWNQLENFSAHASVSIPSLSVGTHTITSVYTGDSNHANQTASAFIHTVNAISTTTTLSSNAGLVYFGEPVTFTANVANAIGSSYLPTGTVTFKEGSNVIGSASVNGSGIATFTISSLPVSGYSVTAMYNGDSQHNASSSNSLTQSVIGIPTISMITASPAATAYGNTVSLTATVANSMGSILPPGGTVTFKEGSTILGTQPLSSGIATITTAGLGVGTHTLTAQYEGSLTHVGSVSGSVTVVINLIPTSAVLSLSGGTSSFGEPVTLTTTVANTNGSLLAANGGTVTFKDGALILGTATLNGGSASFTATNLGTGAHTFTTEYAGDPTHGNSSSTSINHTVNKANTTIVISPTTPIVIGNSTTLMAQVVNTTNNSKIPTGTVTFKANGSVLLSPAALNGSGAAVLTVLGLPVGNLTITAEFSGDADHQASAASPVTLEVSKAPVALTLSTASESIYGQPVAITVRAANTGSGVAFPTGKVSISRNNGADMLVSGLDLDGSGSVTWTSSDLLVGTHQLMAHYAGDNDHLSADSTEQSVLIKPIPATVDLTAVTQEAPFGTEATFIAHVSNAEAYPLRPMNKVRFQAGNLAPIEVSINDNGDAVFVTASLPVGVWTVQADYLPDEYHTALGNAKVSYTVIQAETRTTVSSAGDSTVGGSTTFTAQVTNTLSAGIVPTGTVAFQKDGIDMQAPVSIDNHGTATLTVSDLPVGDAAITATYSGDVNHKASVSSMWMQPVAKAPVHVELTVVPNSDEGVYSHLVTLKVQVTNTNSGVTAPTGEVSITGTGESPVVWPSRLTLSNGTAVWQTDQLPVGQLTFSANYLGDGDHVTGQSSSFTLRVKPIPTIVELTASVTENVYYGSPITFKAHVTNANGETLIPAGKIRFSGGNLAAAEIDLDTAGYASLTTAALLPGTVSIQATYVPDAVHQSQTSSSLTQVIMPNTQGTVLVLNHSSANFNYGEPIPFAVSVGALIGDPALPGAVSLRENGVEKARVTADVYGTGEIVLTGVSSGTHHYTAIYERDGISNGTESQVVTVVVKPQLTQIQMLQGTIATTFPTIQPWFATVVHGPEDKILFVPASAEASTKVRIWQLDPQSGAAGTEFAVANGQSEAVHLKDGLNRFLIQVNSLDASAASEVVFSIFYKADSKRWDLANVLPFISLGYDMDGNQTFNKADVKELLKLIEPISMYMP